MKRSVVQLWASSVSSASSSGFVLPPKSPLILPQEARIAIPTPSKAAIKIWMMKLPELGSRYGCGEKCMVAFYSVASGTISSRRKVSEQLVHWASRLFAMTSKPPHLGHGCLIGFFHEVKSQFG